MSDNFKLSLLSPKEMETTNGGGKFYFTYDFQTYFLLKTIFEFSVSAAEFQASLPPNLKK